MVNRITIELRALGSSVPDRPTNRLPNMDTHDQLLMQTSGSGSLQTNRGDRGCISQGTSTANGSSVSGGESIEKLGRRSQV